MYKNNCIKCGVEFETKNPKRVICPSCLYPDKKDLSLQSYNETLNPSAEPQQRPARENSGQYGQDQGYNRRPPQQGGGFRRPQQGGYNQGGYNQRQGGGYNQGQRQGGYNQGGGYQRQGGGYNQGQRQGGYQRQGGGYNQGQRQGGYQRQGGGYNQGQRPGGFRRPQGGPPRRPMASNKKLLVSREQVAQIEELYTKMLPLPNPDCHEVIGEQMELEPNKVFFGINLVRQKLKLPKLPYPKRRLAVSTDQLMAIQSLYEPLLPLPPIGCHKIIAKQLKIDEWRVHVGIGIIRKQKELPRWNTDREDAPEEFKNQKEKEKEK